MTIQTEVLKLAQDVIQMLGAPSPLHFSKDEIIKWQKCNAAIKEALAQDDLQALHDENERLGLYKDAYAQPEQEPVGYFNANSDGKWEQSDSNDGVPFYAALPPQLKEPAVAEQHKQEPTNDWSEWRGMVVQNLMRHGIDKDFARRLAHFYQDKAPQPKEPEQEPLEYWNAVEGWVKIDEVREHFDSVGCGTIYKTSGEGRVPLSLWKAQPEQKPAYSSCFRCVTPKKCSVYGCCPNTWPSENATPPQRKPLTDEMVVAAARVLNERQADACGVDRDDQWAIYSDDFKADALAMLKAAHGIKE